MILPETIVYPIFKFSPQLMVFIKCEASFNVPGLNLSLHYDNTHLPAANKYNLIIFCCYSFLIRFLNTKTSGKPAPDFVLTIKVYRTSPAVQTDAQKKDGSRNPLSVGSGGVIKNRTIQYDIRDVPFCKNYLEIHDVLRTYILRFRTL